MMLRKILAVAALTLGAGLVLPATSALASTSPNWQNQCQQDRDDCLPPPPPPLTFHRVCIHVMTPPIENLTYVENTTGVVVTVTLDGTFYWVQLKDTNGHITYLGPTTTTLILPSGWSISVAWHPGTGPHSWYWNGEKCRVVGVPTPCGNVWDRDGRCVPCLPPVPDPCHGEHGTDLTVAPA